MPNLEQGFSLQELKTDPKMWMRLAMPSKNGGHLESVFKDKENPLAKDTQAAVETLERLAAEGNLYLRDLGRARHFHKVEKDGNELKLGGQHEMTLSNRTAGPVLGGLMRLSRAYFKWIGLDGISNWFDERLKRRAEINDLNKRYKDEYKSLSKEEKKELKALRKHEENLQKLDEAKERSNETKKTLDAIRGKETTETLEELEAMLAEADQRSADNRSPEKEFARRALLDHEENLEKVGEARNDANEKKKTLDAIRGKETTETLAQLEQMLSNADQIERRRGGPLSANARKARKALRDYVKSLRELDKTEKKAEGTKKKLDETLGRETTETLAQLKEMLGISPEEANERRALRSHVENLRKQEKAQKEAEKTRRELDQIRGVDSTKTKGEMDAPLSRPPELEQDKNTMQPTRLGDQPVQEQKPVLPTQGSNLVQQTVVQHEITGSRKEAPPKDFQIFIGGKELTEENSNEFPPHVVEAFKLIQQLIIEKEANEKGTQQPVQEQPPEIKEKAPQTEQTAAPLQPVGHEKQQEEKPPVTEEVKQDGNAQKEGILIDLDAFQLNTEEIIEPVQTINLAELEQILQNSTAQPTANTEGVRADMTAPLNEPPKVEEEKVNIQGRPKEQAKPTLQERLAAEKQAMDSAISWKDNVVNALFSHEENSTAKDYYEMLNKSSEAAGAEFLAGAVIGILSRNGGTPEQKQQAMDALLSGKPLGAENIDLINNGIAAYNDAFARKTGGNPDRLASMLADSMRELSYQASRETGLSPRFVMIGRLISNAAKMANENNLELPLSEDELGLVRGAATLSDVTQKYYDARQFLGKEPMDIGSRGGRRAVRDLLMGNAVDKMIQQDKRLGQTITNTQQIMGDGLWAVGNLQTYTSDSATRRGIKQEDIQALLEKPKSVKALGIGISTMNEIVKASQEDYSAAEKAIQKQMELEQQENQPEINPLNMPG